MIFDKIIIDDLKKLYFKKDFWGRIIFLYLPRNTFYNFLREANRQNRQHDVHTLKFRFGLFLNSKGIIRAFCS